MPPPNLVRIEVTAQPEAFEIAYRNKKVQVKGEDVPATAIELIAQDRNQQYPCRFQLDILPEVRRALGSGASALEKILSSLNELNATSDARLGFNYQPPYSFSK